MIISAEFTISGDLAEEDLAKVHEAIVALLKNMGFDVDGSCELHDPKEKE